ncbi:MAG: insulinase family protein [Deltaproteobacteria bacterium]|nr:insulinase family protein [Deltaproteobacteria bacterium]
MTNMQLHQWTLSSGVQVVFEHAPQAQITSFDLIVGSGQATEAPGQKGWTHLITSMYDRGCRQYNEEQIQKQVYTYQIDYDGIMGNHFLGLEFQVPQAYWQKALTLCKAMLIHPLFESNKLAQEVQVITQEITKLQNDPGEVLALAFFKQMFEDHPYAHHAWGDASSLLQATTENLRVFYTDALRGQWYLNIVGDHDPEALRSFLEDLFTDIVGAHTKQEHKAVLFTPTRKQMRIPSDFHKLYGALGFPLCEVAHQDRFALEWIRQYWVHALGGRLFERIREELGLVYDIDCSNSFLRDAGCMLISYAADMQAEAEIDQVLQQEIQNICQQKIPSDVYIRMQKYIRGSAQIEWDPVSNHVDYYNQAKLYQTTLDYQQELEQLLAVTREDIQTTAQKYFTQNFVDVKLVTKGESSITY